MRFLLLLLALSFTFAQEGFIVKQYSVIFGYHGVKKKERTVYLTPTLMVIEDEKEYFVQKVENGLPKLYRIRKSDRVYVDVSDAAPRILETIPFLSCKNRVCKLVPDAVVPTDEWRTIRGYKARKVIVKPPYHKADELELYQWYTKEWEELVEANRVENAFYANFLRAVAKAEGLT
ncbi:MAG: hypothetical protein GXO03_01070, partial [Aquificae bacterium]|nr:hypothetical protein [Aquificota bacterium]